MLGYMKFWVTIGHLAICGGLITACFLVRSAGDTAWNNGLYGITTTLHLFICVLVLFAYLVFMSGVMCISLDRDDINRLSNWR